MGLSSGWQLGTIMHTISLRFLHTHAQASDSCLEAACAAGPVLAAMHTDAAQQAKQRICEAPPAGCHLSNFHGCKLQVGNLQWLAAHTQLPLIQLLDPAEKVVPDTQQTYGSLMSEQGLAGIPCYAAGIGPHKRDILGAVHAGTTLMLLSALSWAPLDLGLGQGQGQGQLRVYALPCSGYTGDVRVAVHVGAPCCSSM